MMKETDREQQTIRCPEAILEDSEMDEAAAEDLVPVVDLYGRHLSPCSPEKAADNLRSGLAVLRGGILHLNYRPLAYRRIYQRVKERDGLVCAWCNGPGSTLEHVIPICWGGRTALDNCVIACRSCNHSRNNLLPSEFIEWTGFRPTHPVILRVLANESRLIKRSQTALRYRPLSSCVSKEEAQIWLMIHQNPRQALNPDTPERPVSKVRPDAKPFYQVFLP
ncbi:MAG: HNH endonuclease [Firmicutes bacterium]|nr:HNH endonuclease [Bacillota bacterium]